MGAWITPSARQAGDRIDASPDTARGTEHSAIESEANRLVETYADTILRVSYTYLRSTQDAEDICQDVLLKALGHAGSFDSAEHERAWIIRVAINAAKDLLRHHDRQGFTVNGNSAVVDELAISPLGASITYTVDAVNGPSEPTGRETNPEMRAGHGNFSVTFIDGTSQELGSGFGSWRKDGTTAVQKTWFIDQIRPVNDIASITVGDLTVPVK